MQASILKSFSEASERAGDVLLAFVSDVIVRAPLFLVALVFLGVCILITLYFSRWLKSRLSERLESRMLAELIAKIIWVPALILSLFISFKIAGFSGLAFSFLGGTGFLGLVIGFAFKDIGENFLASILIGIQRPFRSGDIVKIGDVTGVVDRVTSRGTILMSFEGNHIQVPNTTVYKSIIHNLTTNPKIRFDFEVGIGFDVDLNHAISVAREVICNQEEVLDEPEALFLIEKFGAATISLRIYFWINGQRLSGLKVRSKLMRQIKAAFERENISMPDEAREIIFPQGVPVRQIDSAASTSSLPPKSKASVGSVSVEEDVSSDALSIKRQLAESEPPESGENLI